MPYQFQDWDGQESRAFRPPEQPEILEDMTKGERERELEKYRRRQIHFFYLWFLKTNNPLYFEALLDRRTILRRKLYESASTPWEGDNISLKADLISFTANQISPVDNGHPLGYSLLEINKCLYLHFKQTEAVAESLRVCDIAGASPAGWVPLEHYERAKQKAARIKILLQTGIDTDMEIMEIEEFWLFNH